jgi:DNA-binding CsgD family transcriptional regulator
MIHFVLLYWSAALFVAFADIAVFSIALRSAERKDLRLYVRLLWISAAELLASFLIQYVSLNLPSEREALFAATLAHFLVLGAYTWTVPRFRWAILGMATPRLPALATAFLAALPAICCLALLVAGSPTRELVLTLESYYLAVVYAALIACLVSVGRAIPRLPGRTVRRIAAAALPWAIAAALLQGGLLVAAALFKAFPALSAPPIAFYLVGPSAFLVAHAASLAFGMRYASNALAALHDPLPSEARETADLDRFGLSSREKEVALLALSGLSNARIGGELFISERTVKNHLVNVYRKVDVDSRLGLMAKLRPAIARSHA